MMLDHNSTRYMSIEKDIMLWDSVQDRAFSHPLHVHGELPSQERLLHFGLNDDVDSDYYETEKSEPPNPDLRYYIRVSLSLLRSGFVCLLPQYMRRGGLRRKKKLHPTSWLDALRGYAAFIVMNWHFFPYQQDPFFQLPFIRVIWAGAAMVDVFFVISGYVLSYRMLKHIRTRQLSSLMDSLASSTFRRWMRLYGSAAAASFIAMVVYRCQGLILHDPITLRVTWLERLREWTLNIAEFGNPFTPIDGAWHRDVHSERLLDPLWTIPVEFRGSLVIFFFCTMSCKLATGARMSLCTIMIVCCYWWCTTYAALFLAGLLIADIQFWRHPERLRPSQEIQLVLSPRFGDEPTTSGAKGRSRPGVIIARFLPLIMLVTGLFLVGEPLKRRTELDPKARWPWPLLYHLIPSRYNGNVNQMHFLLSIGSILIVAGIDSSPTLQAPLTWNISQYLGDLSFGIYAMHVIVVRTLWEQCLTPLRETYLGESAWAYLPGTLVYWLVVLWAADLFTRLDRKVVRFGRWLQEEMFVVGYA